MTWIERFSLFSPFDVAAVVFLIGAWWVTTYIIEKPRQKRRSMSQVMAGYRREWMQQFILRQPRMFDSQILGSLRQGTAFLGSASLIAVGGLLAMLGNTESLTGVASDLTNISAPQFVWEIKIVLMLVLVTNGFLKFIWSNRLFGYCAVVMGALPVDPKDPLCQLRAAQAAELNIAAARAFNRGLRSLYFALAASAWFAGTAMLFAATCLTVVIIARREFASQSRASILRTKL